MGPLPPLPVGAEYFFFLSWGSEKQRVLRPTLPELLEGISLGDGSSDSSPLPPSGLFVKPSPHGIWGVLCEIRPG